MKEVKMKKKYIDGSSWAYMADYKSIGERIEKPYKGYVSLVCCESIKHPIYVDYDDSDNILIDKGYKCVLLLLDDEYFCISAVYNTKNEIVEWYIDMTKENGHDGKPYFVDLYLDIAMSPLKRPVILDEDELLQAHRKKVISEADVDLAYTTCDRVMNTIVHDKDLLDVFMYGKLIVLSKKLDPLKIL